MQWSVDRKLREATILSPVAKSPMHSSTAFWPYDGLCGSWVLVPVPQRELVLCNGAGASWPGATQREQITHPLVTRQNRSWGKTCYFMKRLFTPAIRGLSRMTASLPPFLLLV